eukprot:12930165-Alexandrium_andersonii.AAC.1
MGGGGRASRRGRLSAAHPLARRPVRPSPGLAAARQREVPGTAARQEPAPGATCRGRLPPAQGHPRNKRPQGLAP